MFDAFRPLPLLVTASIAAAACGTGSLPDAHAVAVDVQPESAFVPPDGRVDFTANVTGTAITSVTWGVSEGANCGSVSTGGNYTAPGQNATCHVVATSVADPAKSATATVNVLLTSGLALDGLFVIGVFGMPADRMSMWKNRGANTFVSIGDGCGSNCTASVWDATAKSLGVYQIRGPLSPASLDIGNQSLLAWAHIDEPNMNCGTAVSPQTLCSNYASWKSVDPTRAVYLNFSGLDLPMGAGRASSWNCSASTSPYYTSPSPNGYFACADWYGADAYPVDWYYLPNGGAAYGLPAIDLTVMTRPLDFIRSYRTASPLFSYIEASRVTRSTISGSVTGAQLRAEIWLSVVHGARGIVYFPEVVASTGFRWDGSGCAGADDEQSAGDPNGVCAAIVSENAKLTALGQVLQGAINPAGASATVSSPLEAGWRIAPTGTRYFFVVNRNSTSVSNAQVTLGGTTSPTATVYGEGRSVQITAGLITDSFAPYAVHIYEVQ